MAIQLERILRSYKMDPADCVIKAFGSGLINNTWELFHGGQHFILQRVNHEVFTRPEFIDRNISMLAEYLGKFHPEYLFVLPVPTPGGETLIKDKEFGYFRLFPFVEGSHTKDVVGNTNEAYEASLQFAKFTRKLRGFRCADLSITLPDFHNLALRYNQFVEACKTASAERLENAKKQIRYLAGHEDIVKHYQAIESGSGFQKRVTHHDTKISNVLFNAQGKGLCVIDLDTVMPGFFISDVGDMMRTYLSPVSEEEKDVTKIVIRDDYFYAIAEGYLSEMSDELTSEEKSHFVFAGKFIIYMQALRFLTDYLNNDKYYGQKYEGHNLVRAINQADLLEKLIVKENSFQKKIAELCRQQIGV